MDTTELHRRLGELRPKLHRYCARMMGSVIDGEDVTQDALAKAIAAHDESVLMRNLDGWVFRIAHNCALDLLRRRGRHPDAPEELDMLSQPSDPIADHATTATSMRTFMHLPVVQRSSVILADVLGYTLREVGDILDSSVPAVKSALHRGRTRLRTLASEPDEPPPELTPHERARLTAYVARFNAREFDALRDMLAEDVHLELVNHMSLDGIRAVGSNYYSAYDRIVDWHLRIGFVDRRPAILVFDPDQPEAAPRYFMLVEFADDAIRSIRDFHFARYAIHDAELVTLGDD